MSTDDFDDEPALDEEDIDDDALIEGEFSDDDEELIDDEELDEIEEDLTGGAVELDEEDETEAAPEEEEDLIVDLEEELHPDDVEEALDVVLRERTAKAGLEDEEEDEEPDDRGEGATRIVPRRPGEFLCSSCFLVLPRHQLADEQRMLCRDCA